MHIGIWFQIDDDCLLGLGRAQTRVGGVDSEQTGAASADRLDRQTVVQVFTPPASSRAFRCHKHSPGEVDSKWV